MRKSFLIALAFWGVTALATTSKIEVKGCSTDQQKANRDRVLYMYDQLKNWRLDAMAKYISSDFVFAATCVPADPWCTAQGLMGSTGVEAWKQTLQLYQLAITPNDQYPDAFYSNTVKTLTCHGDDTILADGYLRAQVRGLEKPYKTDLHAIWRFNRDEQGRVGPTFQGYWAFYEDSVLRPVWPLVFALAR